MLIKSTFRSDIRIDSKTKIETAGIMCSIIDFSFSRLKSLQGELLYCDLSKENWLFEGNSDSCEQYDIYRKMKNLCQSSWAEFHPETNLLWLGHILSSLLTKLPASKRKCQIFEQLCNLKCSIVNLDFKTVHEVIDNRHTIFES